MSHLVDLNVNLIVLVITMSGSRIVEKSYEELEELKKNRIPVNTEKTLSGQ